MPPPASRSRLNLQYRHRPTLLNACGCGCGCGSSTGPIPHQTFRPRASDPRAPQQELREASMVECCPRSWADQRARVQQLRGRAPGLPGLVPGALRGFAPHRALPVPHRPRPPPTGTLSPRADPCRHLHALDPLSSLDAGGPGRFAPSIPVPDHRRRAGRWRRLDQAVGRHLWERCPLPRRGQTQSVRPC